MARLIFRLAGVVLSVAVACVSFILCNYSERTTIYAGCGFGLASILIFSIAVNSGGKIKKNPPAENK